MDDIAARRELVRPLFERLFSRASARCNARDLFCDTGSTQLSLTPIHRARRFVTCISSGNEHVGGWALAEKLLAPSESIVTLQEPTPVHKR